MIKGKPLFLEEVRARLGSFELGPVSLDLPAGSYLVLLGPSGCGKTSLLRTVCGLQSAAGGRIRLGEMDLGPLPPEKRRIGYLPQEPALFPHLDVSGNIAFAFPFSRLGARQRQERLDRLVSLLGLEKLVARRVQNLSGGESRRVALARSLAADPDLLLLDEPLSMLDPNSREGMRRILRQVHRETGLCVVHVTHDREEARELAGICAVMNSGRIEQAGTLEEIFQAPETCFTALFVGAGNVVPENGGYLLLRPESFSMQAPSPGARSISGRVTHKENHGFYTRLSLETAGLGMLRAHLPGDPSGLPEPGRPLTLYLSEAPRRLRA